MASLLLKMYLLTSLPLFNKELLEVSLRLFQELVRLCPNFSGYHLLDHLSASVRLSYQHHSVATHTMPRRYKQLVFSNSIVDHTISLSKLSLTSYVWVYSGALQFGSASSIFYDGGSMAAKQNVIVVTINYRTNGKTLIPRYSEACLRKLSFWLPKLLRASYYRTEPWTSGSSSSTSLYQS